MKPYEKSTLWATAVMSAVIVLIIIGGYFSRGYLAFDSGFLILLLSPVILTTWYRAEKREHEYRGK